MCHPCPVGTKTEGEWKSPELKLLYLISDSFISDSLKLLNFLILTFSSLGNCCCFNQIWTGHLNFMPWYSNDSWWDFTFCQLLRTAVLMSLHNFVVYISIIQLLFVTLSLLKSKKRKQNGTIKELLVSLISFYYQ